MTEVEANPLRQARVAAGIGSAVELAGLSGVSSQTVYDIENGQRPRFGDPTVIRLAKPLGVDADTLIKQLREWYAAREPAGASS